MRRFTYLLLFLLLATAVFAATPNPGHDASRIGPGVFPIGDYTFNGSILVQNTTNRTLFYINASSGNIGVGTATPVRPIDVAVESGASVIQIRNQDGAFDTTTDQAFLRITDSGGSTFKAGAGYLYRSATGPGMYLSSADQLFIEANVSTSLATHVFNGAGLVGIGTVSPTQRLDVNGSINISNASGSLYVPRICLNGDCQTSWPAVGGGSNDSGWQNTSLAVSLVDATDNVSAGAFFIDNTNNRVGIGTTTPIGKLNLYNGHFEFQTVLDGADAYDTYYKRARAGPAAVQSGDEVTSLYFQGHNGSDYLSAARIQGAIDGSPGNADMPGRLVFYTAPDGSATPVERMRIDSSGNISIGTSTPESILTVADTGQTSVRGIISGQHYDGAAGATVSLRKSRGTPSAPTVVQNADGIGSYRAYAYNGSTYLYTAAMQFSVNGTVSGASIPTDIYFTTGSADGGGNEVMRLSSTGNVGIGTTSPNASLHLAQDTATSLRISRSGYTEAYLGLTNLYQIGESTLAIRANSYDFRNDSDTTLFAIDEGGSVNVTSASAKLHVPEICLNGVCSTTWSGGVSSAGGWTNTTVQTSTSLNVSVDSGVFFVDTTNNKVGVGTSAPSSIFQTRVGADQNIGFDSSGGETRITVFNDAGNANTGLRLQATDYKFFNNAGAGQIVTFNGTTGYVGIGTTYPDTMLELNTATAATSATTGAKLKIEGNANTGYSAAEIQLSDRSADNNWNLRMTDATDDGSFRISHGASGANTYDRFTILTSGNVGIGTATPTGRLHIMQHDNASYVRFAPTAGYDPSQYFFRNTSSLVGIGRMQWAALDNNSAETTYLTMQARLISSTSGSVMGGLQITPTGGGYVTLDSGRFGVGAMSPTTAIHVNSSSENDVGSRITIEGSSTVTGNTYSSLVLRNAEVIGGATSGTSIAGVRRPGTNFPSTGLRISTVNNGASVSAFEIDHAGNVGINTTAPNSTLHVIGNANISTRIYTPEICLNGVCSSTWSGGSSSAGGWTNTTLVVGLSDSADNVSAGVLHVDNTNSMVGVGTASPTAKLQVNSDLRIVGASPSLGILTDATGGSEDGFIVYPTSTGSGLNFNHYSGGAGGSVEMYLNGTTGGLGLGTTAPSGKLEIVSGSSAVTAFGSGDAFEIHNEGTGDSLRVNDESGDTTPFIINASGSVGIGTATPSYKLHVVGTAAFVDQVDIKSGKKITFENTAGDASFNIFNNGTSGQNELRIQAPYNANPANNIRFVIDNSGYVGVATTAPRSMLHVSRTAGSGGGILIEGDSAVTGAPKMLLVDVASSDISAAPAWVVQNSADAFSIERSANVSATQTPLVTVSNTGFVGIGTTAPIAGLHLNVSSANSGLRIVAPEETTVVELSVAAGDYGYFALGGNTVLRGGSQSSHFAGNLGIGTTAPTQSLDVNGSINISGASGILYVPQVCLNDDCRTSWPTLNGTSIAAGWTNTTSLVSLSNTSNNVSANALFIDNANGRVGIGTSSPQSKLHITGSDTAARFENTADVQLLLVAAGQQGDGNVKFIRSDDGYLAFGRYNDAVGSSSVQMVILNNSNVGIGTTNPSDGKLVVHSDSGIASQYITANDNTNAFVGFGTDRDGTARYGHIGFDYSQDVIKMTYGGGFDDIVAGVVVSNTGNVGIGTASPTQALHVAGNANITGNVYYGGNLTGYGADFAERFTVAEEVLPTDVVCLREDGKIEQCSERAQNAVAGIVSTHATIIGNAGAPDSVPVGIVGIVPTKVVGPVKAFDLLTTSSKDGYAEKATSKDFGAIVGKAMESCSKSTCVIDVLVGLR